MINCALSGPLPTQRLALRLPALQESFWPLFRQADTHARQNTDKAHKFSS